MEPGSATVPTARNQRGPYRAMSARWASVSAFCTRVGAPPRPRSLTRGGWKVGRAGPPPSRFTTAVSWPARNRGGACVIVTASRSRPRAVAFGQRAQDLRAGRAVQVQVRLGGADRLRGQLQAVEHEVRRELQQELVLAAGRLALRAVGHDHRAALAHAGPGDRGQLPVHREGRAAAAGQAGRLDVVDERAELVAVGSGAVAGQVGAQVLRRGRQQAGQPGSLPGCPACRRFGYRRGHRVTWEKTAATRLALGTCRAA